MSTRIGVVTFPGTLDDGDALRAVARAGATPVPLWHGDTDLDGVEAVIIPGGFSYGDYLRSGAISALSPMMRSVVDAANKGMPVLGICNGFQILTEARLLPGVLTRNKGLHFHCEDAVLEVASNDTAWTSHFDGGQKILIPAKHGEGRYQASADTIKELEDEGRVVFRYTTNINGSLNDIAGVCSTNRRVVGLMPHPEHAIDLLTGPSTDGLGLLFSVMGTVGA